LGTADARAAKKNVTDGQPIAWGRGQIGQGYQGNGEKGNGPPPGKEGEKR